MSKAAWKAICADLRTSCARTGLDLLQPFSVSAYNAAVSADQRLEGFDNDGGLGILIGNTRALWPAFTRALGSAPALAGLDHPLDAYLEAQLAAHLPLATERRHRVHWAHTTMPRALPIQRIAEAVGLATLSPSHLSIHPSYGPWIALRAVVVIDALGPSDPPAPLHSPCAACTKPCILALDRALDRTGRQPDARAIAEHADTWIAIRDACPVGIDERYSDAQLRYHYSKDASLLRATP